MKRTREERFKKSVEEIHQRIGRADNFLESQLMENKCMENNSSRSELNTEVYRDKNTLVEVTIHRKPKPKPWKDSLSDTENHFAKPTSSSMTRSKQSPRKVKKGELSGKNLKVSGGRENEKESGRKGKKHRSVQELLEELRNIVKVSGIKDVHDFLEEFEAPAKSVNAEKPKRVVNTPKKLCQKPDHSDLEAKIHQLENDCQKYRTDATRYKHEHGVMVKQVEISRETVNSLESQVGDLKKIISRLTRNNGELLGIVSEKIKYEDMIADLEKKSTFLSHELSQEKSHSSMLEQRLHSAEAEAAGLRSLSADLRAGLRHGLAGLELPRPDSRPTLPPLGDDTRNILGMSGLGGKEEEYSDSGDSAFDDPNTESLQSRPKIVQNKNKNRLHLSRSIPQMVKQIQPATSSQVFRLNTNVQPNLLLSPPTKIATTKPVQPTTNLSPLQPTSLPTVQPPPNPPQPQISPPPTSSTINLFPAQSRSSTLVTVVTSPTFQPLPLDLSETATQLDGIEKQSFSPVPNSSKLFSKFSPTKNNRNSNPEVAEKYIQQSLETKVSDFLARLHQDSLHLDLDIPQPQSFQGPSMHLSLSSSDMDSDMTRETINTTLTEGKFLRGLETSIEVLQADLSKNCD